MTHLKLTHRSPHRTRLGTAIVSAATAVTVIAGTVFVAVTGATAATVGYNLGTAGSYAILAGTALTSNGINTLGGTGGTDVGVSPSATMTALEPSIQGHGEINLGNAKSAAAQADALIAYNTLRAATPVTQISGELGGTNLPPGIYTPAVAAAAITMNTSFTLDAGGNPNAVWVFKTDAAASTAAGISMNLIGGAQAANVYWAVGAAFSTGAGASVAGHFLAAGAISLGAASTINGQLIGLTLAPVTISAGANITNSPSSSTPKTVWVDETLGGIRSGVAYSDGVTATSGDGSAFDSSTLSFQISGGSLPAGLSLNTSTGAVTGTTTTSGPATWTITARITGYTSVSKTFTITVAPGVQPYVDLGSAASYAIIGQSNITNVGVTNVSGDLGTDVGVELGPVAGAAGILGAGTINIGNTAYTTAHNDLLAAMTYANSLTPTPIPAELAALTLTPGVYEQAAAIGFTGTLTLDAMGNPNSVFIIRTPAAFVTAASATVALTRGAQACNVYWVIGGAVVIGATNNFSGHIMGAAAVGVGAGSTINGQVLASSGATVISGDTIVNSACLPSGTIAIDGGATVTTNDITPTISGTTDADAGSPVTVTVDGQTLTSTVTASGTWTVSAASLTGTTFAVLAKVRNLAGGGTSATQTLTLDNTPPTLTVVGGAADLTNDTTPTVSGTSDAIGRTVTGTIATQTLTAVVAADGTWSVTSAVLTSGDHTVYVSVSDAAGNTETATQELTVDLSSPALTINGGETALTNDGTPTIAGTSDAIGRTVTVTIASQTLTAVVAADGTWSVTAATLADAGHTVTATVADASGNPATATQTLTTDTTAPTLTITGGVSKTTGDTTPTISGTSDAIGRTVTVTVAGQTLTAVVAADGAWTVTVPVALTNGAHTVSARVTDLAGNATTATQTLTVDTVAPTLTITGGATATTGDTTPTISGTSDAIGQTVAVGVAGETTLWSATVLADGTWSVVVGPLTAGDHAVGAGVRNALLTPTVTSQTLTVDVTAPALTIVGGAAVLTKDSTPTISGTSDAIGRVVTVVVDEGTAGVQTLTATVSSAGTWSVTAATLLDAGHTVTASVADAVGNPATATQTLTTDTTAPALTITGGGTATTGDTTPTVSGTSDEIGKTVTVTVGSVTRTAVVGSDGVWSVTLPTLPAGVNTVSAAVTDTAGNTTTVTQSLTVDSSLPLLSINGGASQTTADITPAISGTSDEIGATVTVVVDEGTGSEQTVTAVVAADGTWSVEPTVLTEGVHTVSASVADTAGNPATATQTLTTDTTAPTLTINGGELLTTADSTPTISGTSDAIGRTVSVTVDGRTLTATVTAGGTWSVTSATLTAGDYTVTAKVDDRVGNETTETQTLTVDLNAPTLSIDGGSTASTTSSTPTVTGKSNAVGRTVTVTVAGQTLTTVVEADGTWSVGVAEIIRGTYTVSATVTDALARTVSAYQNLAYPSAPAVIFNTTKAQTVQRGDGDPITVTGNGFRAGESVEIWLHSTPVKLGTLTANATGFITGVVNDTKSTPLGIHHIVLTGLVSGTSADSFDITVEAGAKTLPFTGFEALGWFLVALLALLLGAMAVLIAKLRRRTGES